MGLAKEMSSGGRVDDGTDHESSGARFTPHTENLTRGVVEVFASMARRGALKELLAADFQLSDRRTASLVHFATAADLRDLLDNLGEVGEGAMYPDLLAVRGQNFGMAHVTYLGDDGGSSSMLVVAECGNDGLLTDITLHDQTDLRDAMDRLVVLYAKSLPPHQMQSLLAAAQVRNALSRRDFDGFDALLTADFEHRDSRDRLCLTLVRPEVIDYFGEILSDDEAGVTDFVTEIHAITSRGLVASRTQLSIDAPVVDGTEVVLVTRRGQLVDRMEFYNDHDLGLALDRLEELTSSPTQGTEGDPVCR